jgi:hypothetical protein
MNIKISRPDWPVKAEAQPVQIDFKDRQVVVYISEEHELVVELQGDIVMEINQGNTKEVKITLPSDM